MSSEFAVKDSGARQEFSSGMVRDTTEGKVNFLNVRFGPMLRRWAAHLTKGREKYPDVAPGTPNWTLASGTEEYLRAKESAARHFEAWLAGERDEDHAAGVYFNINLAEYVLEQTEIDPRLGADVVPGGCGECEERCEYLLGPEACNHKSPHGWYCERVPNHCGDHGLTPGEYPHAEEQTWPR